MLQRPCKVFYATHHEWSVDGLVEEYTSLVETATNQQLRWNTHDLALQNIQARARAPGIWMMANLENKLLLATSNRSEAAVGYTTMDGDTCGGLSPIAGIDKAFLRRWLQWMEHEGPHGLHAVPELEVINSQAPTAELRPTEQGQTDEEDLMPYPVLDAIEKLAIRDKLAPVEVAQQMRVTFPNAELATIGHWVRRFFFNYGAEINGNERDSHLHFTSMMKTWIRRLGADIPSYRVVSDWNWPN